MTDGGGSRSTAVRDFRPPLLALRALGLGDLCTIVPALRGLRAHYREYRIVLACPADLHELAFATGAVDEALDVRGLVPFRSRLPPVIGVNLHGRGPESHRILLRHRPAELIAFRHADVRETSAMPEWDNDEHEVERWCRLLASFGVHTDSGALDIDASQFGPAPRHLRGATVIHPGASAPARCWPAARYGAVARAEARAGRKVVITGSSSERARCLDIAARAGLEPTSVIAGTTSVGEIAAIVAVAGRVICGDTGIAHLATALRRPSVVLFGPVSPARWGPPPSRQWHRALWRGHSDDPHARQPDTGLLRITTDDVLNALSTLPEPERITPFPQPQ